MVQVKKNSMRLAIIEAARATFLAEGFQGAGMRAIAQKAGCSPGNIYSYFADKDALMQAVTEDAFDRVRGRIESIWLAGGALSFEDFERQLLTDAERLVEHHDDWLLVLSKSRSSKAFNVRERMLDSFQNVVRAQLDHVNPAPAPAGRHVSSFFVETVARYYLDALALGLERGKTLEDWRGFAREAAPYLYHGLRALASRSAKAGGDTVNSPKYASPAAATSVI